MLTHHAMQLLLLSLLAASFAQCALVENAPSASDLDGVHILIDNDLDSLTNDTSVIFLSKKRNYQDSLQACEALGERTCDLTLLLSKFNRNVPLIRCDAIRWLPCQFHDGGQPRLVKAAQDDAHCRSRGQVLGTLLDQKWYGQTILKQQNLFPSS